jgi:hypothetical protein
MRSSQKILGMMVFHCNGGTYGNAYLIILKVGPLRVHLHAHAHARARARARAPVLPLLEAPAEASFGIFRSLAIAFELMSSRVVERVPLNSIFRVGNRQKSLRSRSEGAVV